MRLSALREKREDHGSAAGVSPRKDCPLDFHSSLPFLTLQPVAASIHTAPNGRSGTAGGLLHARRTKARSGNDVRLSLPQFPDRPKLLDTSRSMQVPSAPDPALPFFFCQTANFEVQAQLARLF